jgi:hypothetical protein
MEITFGLVAGPICALIGTAIGLSFAWAGFSSSPYSAGELGMFFGVVGALVGISLGIVGVVLNQSTNGRRAKLASRA